MLNYYVNDELVDEKEFNAQLEDAVRNYVEENIDDLIDEENEEIHIGSLTFNPSYVLEKCDPIAYSCYINDEQDALLSDYLYEFQYESEEEIDGTLFKTESYDDESEENE